MPFTNPQYIRPACLWQSEIIESPTTIAIGFGADGHSKGSLDILMKVQLSLFDIQKCVKAFEDDETVIDERQICAGNLTGGRDTCQGGKKAKTFE